MKIFFVASIVLFELIPFNSFATVLNFEDISESGVVLINSYSFENFIIENDANISEGGYRFFSYPSDYPSYARPESRTLASTAAPSVTTISMLDGGKFSFYSIDMAEGGGGEQYSTVAPLRFSFVTENGVNTEDVFFDDLPGLQTFTFSGRDQLLSVSWTQTANQLDSSSFSLFDNIFLRAEIRVPEPNQILIFMIGVCMIFSILFRKFKYN